MNVLTIIAVAVCVLAPGAYCESSTVEWCYHNSSCSDSTWPTIAPLHCNGTRQSPINIASANATENKNLTEFTFEGYDNKSALATIENTGDTVKVTFNAGIKISGGALSESYDSLQAHLHWGNGTAEPGSEHTVDGKRFPMELHIVHSKSTYNRNITLAEKDPEGLAALGFFIEELTGVDDQPASWKTLTSYFSNISNAEDTRLGGERGVAARWKRRRATVRGACKISPERTDCWTKSVARAIHKGVKSLLEAR
ncbi:carbonic anhydrase 4-like isoform X3 [Xiphophorus maculatus]|uniref:carbonic anhydrase 4-like isoform X3 n=1 Tax=Xiphophorus maculatus TaxID=8083 RepID=UPI000C6CC65A|nr:carbonic anhydrase 4-like isoform X3 [Xiphophorus maculatus]